MSSSYITERAASDLVTALFETFLGREPDKAGHSFYVSRILTGGHAGMMEVIRTVMDSEEAVKSASGREGTGRVSERAATIIVMNLYREILGREADPAGLAFYVSGIVSEPQSGFAKAIRDMSQTSEAVDLAIARERHGKLSHAAAEIIIRALYQALVGHEPDDVALNIFANAISGDTVRNGMRTTMRQLMTSEEVIDRFERTSFVKVGIRNAIGQAPHAYERRKFLSLGTTPYPARLLDLAGVKVIPGPFDAIYSSPRMVTHCLEDDFRTFLDRRHFRHVTVEDGGAAGAQRCEHLFYKREFGIDLMFDTCDPLDDEGYDLLVHSVEQFRQSARAGEESLAICAVADYGDGAKDFEALAAALDAYAPATFLSFVRQMLPGPSLPSLTDVTLARNGRSFAFQPSSRLVELAFRDGIDAVAFFKAATGLVW